ncbi:protein FAM81B [Labrus mixtus]|uniref:protein FAM81B n=1 Tax=Labrus mixtus TaxID=508554 RepID=UPI0029C0514E|nr:protein FAM81B [Labrus mixtus]
MSHKPKLQSYKNHSRSDVLAGGFSGQEMTLAVLLEQAFRIKDEVAAGLQSTRGSLQMEAMSCRLLENHILTVTRIVKHLSKDIQALEGRITERDLITSGTTKAIQELDQKNTAGIGDLRGRVARCDASIAKLSADGNSGEWQLNRLQHEVAGVKSAVDGRLKELKAKFYHDLGRLEASVSEHYHGQKSDMSDLQAQLKQLEDRISNGLKEAKEQTDSLRKWTEQQLDTSAQHCTQQQDKMRESASRLCDRLRALEARVDLCETQKDQIHQRQAEQMKRCENVLSKRMTSVESGLHQELQLLKQEYHKGFLSMHDAIESLMQIGDIKSRLNKEKLQKALRHNHSKVQAELDDL